MRVLRRQIRIMATVVAVLGLSALVLPDLSLDPLAVLGDAGGPDTAATRSHSVLWSGLPAIAFEAANPQAFDEDRRQPTATPFRRARWQASDAERRALLAASSTRHALQRPARLTPWVRRTGHANPDPDAPDLSPNTV